VRGEHLFLFERVALFDLLLDLVHLHLVLVVVVLAHVVRSARGLAAVDGGDRVRVAGRDEVFVAQLAAHRFELFGRLFVDLVLFDGLENGRLDAFELDHELLAGVSRREDDAFLAELFVQRDDLFELVFVHHEGVVPELDEVQQLVFDVLLQRRLADQGVVERLDFPFLMRERVPSREF